MILSAEERKTYNIMLRDIEVADTAHRGRTLEQFRIFVEILKMSQEEESVELFL